jgi:hypothetical protein
LRGRFTKKKASHFRGRWLATPCVSQGQPSVTGPIAAALTLSAALGIGSPGRRVVQTERARCISLEPLVSRHPGAQRTVFAVNAADSGTSERRLIPSVLEKTHFGGSTGNKVTGLEPGTIPVGRLTPRKIPRISTFPRLSNRSFTPWRRSSHMLPRFPAPPHGLPNGRRRRFGFRFRVRHIYCRGCGRGGRGRFCRSGLFWRDRSHRRRSERCCA